MGSLPFELEVIEAQGVEEEDRLSLTPSKDDNEGIRAVIEEHLVNIPTQSIENLHEEQKGQTPNEVE